MYKVFFYDKTIILTDKAYDDSVANSDVVYNFNDLKNFESVVMEFLSDKYHNRAIFFYKDRKFLAKNFFNFFMEFKSVPDACRFYEKKLGEKVIQ